MDVIGFGHDVTPEQGKAMGTISEETGVHLLYADVALCRSQAEQCLPWLAKLNGIRRDVVTEMIFQIGIAGVLKFREFIKYASSGDYQNAASEMLHSKWHDDETAARAEELAALWLEG